MVSDKRSESGVIVQVPLTGAVCPRQSTFLETPFFLPFRNRAVLRPEQQNFNTKGHLLYDPEFVLRGIPRVADFPLRDPETTPPFSGGSELGKCLIIFLRGCCHSTQHDEEPVRLDLIIGAVVTKRNSRGESDTSCSAECPQLVSIKRSLCSW